MQIRKKRNQAKRGAVASAREEEETPTDGYLEGRIAR